MQKDARYLANVRAQYEALPYPARDPKEERERLINPSSERLSNLNHFCFKGRQDFRAFRALVAGAGTGDGTIYLAEQLKALPGARVVSIDVSAASNDVARARARVRGLRNITFLHGSLLDLAAMDLEPFDYVNCTGVLHHLADPDEGLKALKAVVKPEGALGLMVYGRYGRTGVYQMQALMRLINGDEPDLQVKVDNTKAVLACLPAGNWFKRGADLVSDHERMGDAGIYDLFLHEQDRAYTVPEVYAFVERAGLHLVDYCQARDRALLEPATYLRDAAVLERVQALDLPTRRAIAELISGRLTKQHVYAAPSADTVASPDDLDNVPFLSGFPGEGVHLALAAQLRRAPGAPLEVNTGDFKYAFVPRRHTAAIFTHLDGARCFGEIFAAVRAETGEGGLTDAALAADFRPVYDRMAFAGNLMLRHRSVPAHPEPSAGPMRPARRR
jgi:SAM-dependent methyltransferase